tara:strand:- start:290 stop:673 length:384 start_codon:yes stop_codon:yes gene_type:complete
MPENLYASSNISQKATGKLGTRKFFNGHYIENVTINSSEHQAVTSFFLEKTNNKQDAANTLTDTLFEIGAVQGINVMELIDRLRSETIDDIQLSLITLINSQRKKTSVLGFANSRTANPSVLRNIIE